jgi:PAS domain S-box-containing protein
MYPESADGQSPKPELPPPATPEHELNYLHTLIDQIPDLVYARDTANRFMLANQVMARLMGVASPAELIGKTDADFYPPEKAAWFAAVDRGVLEGKSLLNKESTITFPNGETRIIRSTKVPLRNSQGEIIGFIGIGHDITQARQASEANARLATIVEQASEIIIVTDTQGRVNYVNPAFEKAAGYAGAEVMGRNPSLLKSGRHDAAFYEEMWRVLARGDIWHGRLVNRRKDGALYEVDATITPVRNTAGEVIYVAIERDVTAQVQLEAQLRQMQKMDAVGQLAGGIAHDFNNILAAILAQASLLEMDDVPPAELRAGMKQIRADAERAANLTRQLLMFSRRQVVHAQDIDLNQVVGNIVPMLRRIIYASIEIRLSLHPAPLPIKADAGMIEQILLNLAVNARDAMRNGGVLRIVTTEVVPPADPAKLPPEARTKRHACLSVGDTGGGIAPEILPRIFEPFFTTKEAGKGTGMGLATVFGIVKQHGGWIDVDNQPPQGVTFRVHLPAGGEAVPDKSAATKAESKRGNATILWVEDEASMRRLTKLILVRQGYQVIEAANGLEALNLWDQHKSEVKLLLTDIVMPGGITGLELARRLREDHPRLKVIFTSGYSADIAGRELELLPGESFIQKPFQPEDLLQMIQRRLADA